MFEWRPLGSVEDKGPSMHGQAWAGLTLRRLSSVQNLPVFTKAGEALRSASLRTSYSDMQNLWRRFLAARLACQPTLLSPFWCVWSVSGDEAFLMEAYLLLMPRAWLTVLQLLTKAWRSCRGCSDGSGMTSFSAALA